ncbi:hypothetical protein LENED_006864 [Lentinula edodes]|uniref:Uncharacterized protein n=1 Tax=Lentinula edodes TaxID=5353 RepID=A0A1Q3ED25_LENED|nr:hypothetical protein LENED_006864 [Lentinula edodes]
MLDKVNGIDVGVSAVNKEMQKAEVGVDAANIRLEEKLNQVELDIKEIQKLTSPPSTPTRSRKVKYIPSPKNIHAAPRSPLPAGGKVIVHIGARYDAQQAFLVLKNNHKTYELPADKRWGLI